MKRNLIFILCLMLMGCRTVQRSEKLAEQVHDTVRIVNLRRDSVRVLDSVFVNRYVTGDTVHDVVTRWRTEYRDRLQHDTIYVAKDSIRTEVKEVQVEKGASFTRICTEILVIALLFALAPFVVRLIKKT